MVSTVKVSVLIPCYNVEKFLEQCITSVIGQTLQDIEIICINDGSTDKTLDILNKFKKNDYRIKIINKQNTGYGDSMNCALNAAQGEYIGIVESDDFVEANMFQVLYETACRENTEVTRCCYFEYKNGIDTKIENSLIKKNITYSPKIRTEVFWQSPSIWAAIYKRSWLNDNNIRFLPTPGASYQDVSFSFKTYACCERFIMISNAYLHYRVDNQNSSTHSKYKKYCICNEWNEIYTYVFSNKKKFERLIVLLPGIQYCNYKWNFKRLKFPLNIEFLFYWFYEWIIRIAKKEIILKSILLMLKMKIKKIIKI